MKKVIGVLPLWDESKDSVWMLPAYLDAIRECGALAIIFPLKASGQDVIQLCEMCDGFLFTGGHDVNPKLYGEQPTEQCGAPCDERDELDAEVFSYALKHDKAVLGICRGIQLINALQKGSLYQDLPTEHKGVSHQMTAPYNREWHKVDLIENSPLHNLLGEKELGVNSYHHQAIKALSPSLEVMAISQDGLVEGVYMPDKRFVWAVQWHPELDYFCNDKSLKIIKEFIKNCS